jgi:hypothetical protein
VETSNRRSTAVGPSSAYRLGELGVVRVARRVPRTLTPNPNVVAGTSVVVVTERNGKLRMLPGVVVDSVPGRRFGVETKVLRLTSGIREDEAGPVLDAKGRVVGAVFGTDEQTGLGVAVPVAALRGRAVGRTTQPVEACD